MAGTFHIHTFGCQMNVHDSDRMSELLRAHGWREGDVDAADVIVLNTCSVREKAEQKVRSELGRLAVEKRARRDLVLVVAGCVAQQEGDRLLAREPALDLVIGPDNLPELPALLENARAGSPPRTQAVFDVDAPRFLAASPEAGRTPVSAFVTTMKGCDERCSFCIVPYTRGPERYRSSREVLAECKRFAEAGAREIVLLGQTVDSFRDPELPPPDSSDPVAGSAAGGTAQSPDESQFPHLLRAIAREVPEVLRLRYTSPHPRHATPSLARAHAELDVLARHVHLPVQSGSDAVLRRMIRRYTRAEYIERAARLRAARAGLTLSTDLIVGFPGETDADFEATLSLVREVGFVSLFAFKYSPRPYTPALKLKGEVPEDVKDARLAALLALGNAQTEAHLAALVGTTQRVLVCGRSKTGDAFEGRTEANEIVHLRAEGDLVGALVSVQIKRSFKHSLEAEMNGAPLAKPATRAPVRLPLLADS